MVDAAWTTPTDTELVCTILFTFSIMAEAVDELRSCLMVALKPYCRDCVWLCRLSSYLAVASVLYAACKVLFV